MKWKEVLYSEYRRKRIDISSNCQDYGRRIQLGVQEKRRKEYSRSLGINMFMTNNLASAKSIEKLHNGKAKQTPQDQTL